MSLTGEGIADQVAFLRGRLEGWGFTVEALTDVRFVPLLDGVAKEL